MRLVCILTHGQGDMYPVLAILPTIIKERKVDSVKIYVDTVYNSNPDKYAMQLSGIKDMVERITTDWEAVPCEFSGSDQWHGLPTEDQRTGPVYEKIKYDFLFYRLERLKSYIRERITPDDIVIYGPCVWCYEWRNGENVPVDMSPERWSLFKPDEIKLSLIDYSVADKHHVIIQARKKGIYDNYETFKAVGEHCLSLNKIPVYIGVKEELPVFGIEGSIDLRGSLSFDECLWLMEKAEYVITTGSGVGYHRVFFDKPTIFMLPMCWGEPRYSFPSNWDNSKYKFLDCNVDMIPDMKKTIDGWV